MADNTTLPGTGVVVASDDIGTVQFQRVKLIHGADGTNAGDVSTTNGLPADVRFVGGTAVSATPVGFQRVSDEPTQLFYDPFDTTLDTANRWTSTSAGGGVAAAVASGRLTIGSGVTINGFAYLTSQPTFTPPIPGWLGFSFVMKLEFAVGTNAVRFWGMGLVGGTPSSTSPLGATGNGMGFEVDTAGVLKAVLYSNGTRTVINALASNQPADANDHRYIIAYRTDRTDFYIDGLGASQLVATASFQSPQIQVLSMLMLSVAHSTAPAASRVLDCAGLAVWDTAKNNRTQSDGVFGWRKQTILKASTAAAATDSPAAVALHPSSPLPTGANLIGTVKVSDGTNTAAVKAASTAAVAADPAVVIALSPNNNTLANALLTKVSDGTNTSAVKAASTAAVAADPALVVSVSPNSIASVGGNIAHAGTDAGNPIKIGARAVAHGTNPTAVAAAARADSLCNRAGVPFYIGGHPNIVTVKHTTITAAVTDVAVVTVATGLKIVVTSFMFTLDNASTVFPTVLLGFGATTTPTTTGVIGAHGGVPAGGGFGRGDGSGILGIGGDGDDLRVTTTGAATGNGLQLVVTFYTIES